MSHLFNDQGIWLSGAFLARPFANSALIGALAIFTILVVDYLNNQQKRRRLGGCPIVGDAPHLWRRLRTKPINYQALFQSGYDTVCKYSRLKRTRIEKEQFSKRSKPFAVWQQNDDFVIVVPPGTEEEIKNVGPDKLSFLHAVNDSYHFWLHTKILGRSHIDAVQLLVNKNMSLSRDPGWLLDLLTISEELHQAVVKQSDETIPDYFDPLARVGEPFSAFLAIWHLTHVAAASFLVGPEFAKNKKYTDAIEYYCLQTPSFAHMYFWLPAPIRKIYWFLSPEGAKIRASLKTMKQEVGPAIREMVAAWRRGDKARNEATLLRAMLEVKTESGQIKKEAVSSGDRREEEQQVDIFEDELIFTGFDSAGPVVCLVVQLLFETIRHQDIVEPLRRELAAALKASGGEWTDQAMRSLPRMDSFTREVLRVDGPTLFSMTRSVRQAMQLKTAGDLHVRPGSIITSPAWMMHNDAEYYDNPSEFNPWRFYSEETKTVTARSTTTSNKFLVYGYGVGTCPGRHIGIRWSQIMFGKLLMRYDAAFEDVAKGKPDNIVMPGQLLPPYMAKIVLRRREDCDAGDFPETLRGD
ncbi:cytochrome P450 [Paraphaeosphaeria sporulosa]